jgi:hypothetical protein
MKMKKTLSLLLALVLVLALAAVAVPVSANGPYDDTYVDDNAGYSDGDGDEFFETIQVAINNTNPGGTVHVAAGIYDEDITITKGLTLTTPSGSPATIDGGIWIKDIHTYINPITVEYFTIQNGTPITGTRDYGIKISGDIGVGGDQAIVDMHIVHNTFVNVGKTDDVIAEQWWNAAIFYDANHFGALGSRYDTYFMGTGEISYNTIVNNLGDPTKRTQLGIGVRSGLNMRIEHNNISGNVAEGIHLWGPVYTGNTANHQVNHNTIDLSGWIGARIGNNPRGIWTYARDSTYSYNTIVSIWYGMVFSYWDDTNWGGVTAANKPVTIDHNVIHPPTGQSMTAGMRYSGNNGQITDNEIYGATNTSGYAVGLLFEGWGNPAWGERTECKNNTFTGNNIHDNYDGIWTHASPYDNRSNNVFHFNNIYNNTNSGMTIPGAPTVDAENNWWGDASGPTHAGNPGGSGDPVSDDVNYTPWLGAPLELPAVHHESLGAGAGQVVDASDEADTIVTLTTTGDTEISVARYESQPFPDEEFPDEALGKYIDIHVSNPGNVTWPIHVEVSYTDAEADAAGIDESTLGLYYYESVNTFHRCSDTGADTAANFIWANVSQEEAGYLIGTAFGAGGYPPALPKVPTVNHWGIVAMISLFAGLLVWRVRRRQSAL